MAVSAGVILALSLIVAGLAILGDAAGLWSLPGDVFGVVVLLLGTAGKYAKQKTEKAKIETTDKEAKPNGAAPAKRTPGSMWIILIAPALIQCGGMSAAAERDAATWATCAGIGALRCAPSSEGDSIEEAAINWAACIASKAIGCAGDLVQPNPPEGPAYSLIDLGCVTDSANRCLAAARSSAEAGRGCIEAKIAECATGQGP